MIATRTTPRWRLFAILALICCATWSEPIHGKTQPRIRVTGGDHPTFGRIVLEASGIPHTLTHEGDRVLVKFPDDTTLGTLPPPPRNVRAIRAVMGGVELTVTQGAVVHDTRMGNRIVIDIDDTSQTVTKKPAGKDSPEKSPEKPPEKPNRKTAQKREDRPPPPTSVDQLPVLTALPPPLPSPAAAPVAVLPTPAAQAPKPTPAPAAMPTPIPAPNQEKSWPVVRDSASSGPVGLVVTKVPPPAGLTGSAIQFPFSEPIGAAMFNRGGETIVVFDERRPVDLAALRDDPIFGAATAAIFPTATVIRVPTPREQRAVMSRGAGGWRLSMVRASPKPGPLVLVPAANNDTVSFASDAAGQVVTMTDPQTGGTLLVGTQRQPGQAVLTERRTAEYILPVTGQGLVIDPLAQSIGLRIVKTGFVLTGGAAGLAVSPATAMTGAALAAAGLTRRFEFPGQKTDALISRAKRQAMDAAAAAPLARGPKRRALAETMLGLGLGTEARTLLRIAAMDDPQEAASPVTAGLAAIGSLLSGRPSEAADLADPRLDGTDEVALWRAIQTAMNEEGAPAAAAALAPVVAMLFTYPEAIQRRVLPLALETMILGGEAAAAAPLLAQRPNDPQLRYANALLKQAKGENEAALKLFDEVTNHRSPLDHARAAVRAIELRMAMGQLDAKAAADALEKRLYAWRGDGRDLALRLRIADLRGKAEEWHAAYSMLQGAKTDFPAAAPDIDQRLKAAIAGLPRDVSVNALPPAGLVKLLEENAGLLADGPDGEPMRARLAEQLMALDLPKRADTVLTKLMRAASPGPARAGFGATLAALRLREGDPNGAVVALSESSSADMPEPVRERRAVITAQVDAKRGDVRGAIETLAGAKDAEADSARAAILEQAKDWPAARDALKALADRTIPPEGKLVEAQQRLLLRLATAAAHAGDDAALTSLRETMQPRFGAGASADMFRLLTAAPVRGVADLGRARAEMGLARSIAGGSKPR